jgi:hypothetical protein
MTHTEKLRRTSAPGPFFSAFEVREFLPDPIGRADAVLRHQMSAYGQIVLQNTPTAD